jgi:rare lipoprotein A (peptidoglycan hydrolase)
MRGALLVTGMVLVPLLSLLHVGDAIPGVEARTSVVAAAASPSADAERQAALAERTVRYAASRSRTSLLSREDIALMATTTTAPPPPPTTARPKPKAVAKPVVKRAAPAAAAKPAPTAAPAPSNEQHGAASFYSPRAADECAHRTLPFGTIVTVTSVATGKSTTCRVGDRGPFIAGRVIDLSRQRFAELAPPSTGVIRVRLTW